MTKAKIILIFLAISSLSSAVLAYKVGRIPSVFYVVDATNPIPANRLCTKTTFITYTTDRADGIPGAPAITTLDYFTTAVASTTCPNTPLFSRD